MKELPLLGYTDRLSARAGETVSFKVSSLSGSAYTAQLSRSICADPNPAGLGIVEEDASRYFPSTQFNGRRQPFYPGSYGLSEQDVAAQFSDNVELEILVFPTLFSEQGSVLLQWGAAQISLDPMGCVGFRMGEAKVQQETPLTLKRWYRIKAIAKANGECSISYSPIGRSFESGCTTTVTAQLESSISGRVVIAAHYENSTASEFFNGKLEAPVIKTDGKVLASWDFSNGISTTKIASHTASTLELINFPSRAMTSSQWDASEMNWRHKPEHYAAIHFHDDDIYDFGWETDFKFKVPDNMPSGVYVMRLKSDAGEDAIPIFISASLKQRRAKLCVLVSTFTYSIYGNHARPDFNESWKPRMDELHAYPYNPAEYPQYGLSTYNTHSDGSGISHASHRRPLFNLRPGYVTFGYTPCSGLRHFQADSHLISWLHAKEFDYEIVTDAELHNDGLAAIEGFTAVTTATHPEYHTEQTLDALRDYRDNGGHLNYLGGNGFYWRIAIHPENDSVLEIRRAEDGIRAWAAEPGEYYNAFDGNYGGLWRRNARAPQDLVGVGFTAQGQFNGFPYQRVCRDIEFDWVFEGITNDVMGDYGFSGQGAAGYELDHCDPKLGTPVNVKLLARSVSSNGAFMLVPEEQLTHITNLSGEPEENILRADMIYFDVPGGGSVFSTGSITFCGSLPWNNFDNDVSRLLENVFQRCLSHTK